MKITKKALIIILVSVLTPILAFSAFAGTTYALYKADKKAVIILPGLFASGLYDVETGKGVWDPFGDAEINFYDIMDQTGSIKTTQIAGLLIKYQDVLLPEIDKLMANDNYGASDSLFNMMAMNEDGTAVNPNVQAAPWSIDNRLKYGVINANKLMYDSYNQAFGKYYDVQVFNYDFRMDNRQSAQKLEEYINKMGYTEIILVSHSNGGQVAAAYLARSKENRKKVTKYISYSAPYYGSFAAIDILENVDIMIGGFKKSIGKILPTLAKNIEEIFNKQFTTFLNIWTAYQLLPTYELLQNEYNGEHAGIFIDGQRVTFESEEDLWDFYCSRPFARTSDGELREPMKQWLNYVDSIKVTLDSGEKVLSTSLVDTVYFSGMNVDTVNRVDYMTHGDEIKLFEVFRTPQGDGTVLYASAVGMTEDQSSIRLADGINHYGVNVNFKGGFEEKTVEAISSSVKKNTDWYYKLWSNILRDNK